MKTLAIALKKIINKDFRDFSNFENLCKEYKKNQDLIDKIEFKNEEIKEKIIKYMGDRDEIKTKNIKVSYKTITNKRFNSLKFKEDYQDLYNKYLIDSCYKRFIVK